MSNNQYLGSTVYGSTVDQKPNEYAGSDRRPTPVYGSKPVYGSEIQLTPAQQAVAEEILKFCRGETSSRVAALQGYAGVGKTTVVAWVVNRLLQEQTHRMSIVVAAPTHKALAVLGERMDGIDVELATLHSLLGLKLTSREDGTQTVIDENKGDSLREHSLAIIDEASMIGPGLFESTLSKRGRCLLLFIGDPAQLPPVEGGDLSPAFGPAVEPQWYLTEVVRQAADNPIIRIATAARHAIAEGTEFGLHDLGQQLAPGDDDYLAIQPGGVVEAARLVADAISHGQDTRALAWDNATVLAVNSNVHAMLYAGQGPYPKGTMLMANEAMTALTLEDGEKVQVRNSALMTVVSSEERPHPAELGRRAWRLVVNAEGQKLVCWVPDDPRQLQIDISECFAEYRRCKLRETMAVGHERQAIRDQGREASTNGWALRTRFAPLRYAYAMTVHKSQGSTFDAVVLAWESFQRSRDVQLRNRLVYVALTRTRRFAVVCA